MRLALCTKHIFVQPWLSDLVVEQRPSFPATNIVLCPKSLSSGSAGGTHQAQDHPGAGGGVVHSECTAVPQLSLRS